MMPKTIMLSIIILVMTAMSVWGQAVVETSSVDNGIIHIQYHATGDKPIRVMIEKEDHRYSYRLNQPSESFPLQMGNGNYTISLMEHIEGNTYKVLHREQIDVNLKDQNAVFLGSIQSIHWDPAMDAIKKAQALVQPMSSDEEKINAIYHYIIEHLSYDYNKALVVTSDYLPQVNQIFLDNKGICYDFASLFAAMLRSVGIPTKLVTGYTPSVKDYHAWNEVYIASKDQWVTIDTTLDAQYKKAKLKINRDKDPSLYKVTNIY